MIKNFAHYHTKSGIVLQKYVLFCFSVADLPAVRKGQAKAEESGYDSDVTRKSSPRGSLKNCGTDSNSSKTDDSSNKDTDSVSSGSEDSGKVTIYFSRLKTLCTPLVWMRIAAVATLYMKSGYVTRGVRAKPGMRSYLHEFKT